MFDELPIFIQDHLPFSTEQIEALEQIYDDHYLEIIALLLVFVSIVVLRFLPFSSTIASVLGRKTERSQPFGQNHIGSNKSLSWSRTGILQNHFKMPAASPQTVRNYLTTYLHTPMNTTSSHVYCHARATSPQTLQNNPKLTHLHR